MPIPEERKIKTERRRRVDQEDYYGGELTASVVKPEPVWFRLQTNPISRQYPISHSQLEAWETAMPSFNKGFWVSKGSDDPTYNLFTANCSDATGKILELVSDQDFTSGITTPASVRKKARKVFGNDHSYFEGTGPDYGADTVRSTMQIFQVPWYNYRLAKDAANEMHLKEIELSLRNNGMEESKIQEILEKQKAESPRLGYRLDKDGNVIRTKKNGGKIGKYQEGRTINYAGIDKDAVENFKYIDEQLIKAGYGYIPRLAILGNIEQESKGDPLAESRNKLWHGIIQWNKDRYRFQSNNAQEELQRQTALLLEELEKTGWSGDTWRDQLKYAQAFKDSTDLRQAVDLFTRRFVRPARTEWEINERFKHAQRGWMDEEPEEVKLRRLPDNLLPAGNPILLNNQVVDTSAKKGIIVKERPKPEVVRKPLNEMTEDDVRSLIYNSFKYAEGGSLVYKPFMPEKKTTTKSNKNQEYTQDKTEEVSKSETFPVESVKILQPDWNLTYAERSPYEEGTVQYKDNNMDVGNMQDLINLMKEEGISFRITSGHRPGDVTSNGTESHHSPWNALDITPISGQSWADLLAQMRNSNRFITYMREHNLGILDERSKEMQAKTGATGPHFHIGPDQSAVSNFKLLFG